MRIIQFFLIIILFLILSVHAYAESFLSAKNLIQRPFSLSANRISTWKKDGIRVFVADEETKVVQGPFQITADTTVCWFHEEEAMQRAEATVEIYCEGNVTILQDENYEKYEQVYLRFETMTGILVNPSVQPIKTFEEPQGLEVVLRGEEIRSMKKEEYLSTAIPQKVLPAGVPRKEEMVDIIADNIESWQEGDKRIVVALGNVKIKKGDMTIDADSVILWFEQKVSDSSKYSEPLLSEIYAEGNVTMRRKDDVQVADRIFEDVKEDKGILINSQIKTTMQKPKKAGKASVFEGLPAFVSADEIRHVAKGQYEIKNGTITTCGYWHPHYHFQGKKIRLIQRGEQNILSSAHNTFYLDKYPVAYFPYFSLDVRKKEKILKDWEFGSSSRFGSFLRTDWDLYAVTGGKQKDWSDLTLNLD